MHEGVIEGGEDVCNTENELTLGDLGAERNCVLFLSYFSFFGGLLKRDQN